MQAHLAELLLGDLLQAALLQKKLGSAALGVFFLLFLGFSSRGRSKQTQGCGMAVPRCAITPVTDSQGDGVRVLGDLLCKPQPCPETITALCLWL